MYSVTRVQKRNVKSLEQFQQRLTEYAPEFLGMDLEGFKILGKTAKTNQFVGKKGLSYYVLNIIKDKKVEQKPDLSNLEMNLDTVRLKDITFNKNLFIPVKSGLDVDYCFSKQGGIMPATNYIVIGDPGIGKSSLCIEFVANIKKNNPDKKVLFISAEMTEWDMIPYVDRFPLWSELDILFTSKLTEGLYLDSIKAKFKEGWDIVLIDSFSELADGIRGDINEVQTGKNKKSYNDVEKILVDLMVEFNGGKNDLELNTSFISIQQVTKDGTALGTNKLKHNTTGMLEIRYTKGNERKIVVTKNRRGFEYQDLFFTFNEDLSSEPLKFDIERIIRDKKINEEIRKIRETQLDEESETDKWIDFKNSLEDEYLN